MYVETREQANICDICLYLSAILNVLFACFLIYFVIEYNMDAYNLLINILTILGLISMAAYMCSRWHADCCSFTCFFIFELWLCVQGCILIYAANEDDVILTGWDDASTSAYDEFGDKTDEAIEWQFAIGIGLVVISLGAIISVCKRRNNTQDVVYNYPSNGNNYNNYNNNNSKQPQNYAHYDRI